LVSCCSVKHITSNYTFLSSRQSSAGKTEYCATECFLADRIHFENRYYAPYPLTFWRQKNVSRSSYPAKGTPTVPSLLLPHQKHFVINTEIIFCVSCDNKLWPLVLKRVKFRPVHTSQEYKAKICAAE